jgi:hypothetical protein
MSDVFRFASLKKKALKMQGEVALTEEELALSADERALRLKRRQKQVAADYLLFSGLDLKGQTGMAVTAKGAGVSTQVAINPFGLIGVTSELQVSAAFKGAKQRSVVVMRGPEKVSVDGTIYAINGPLLLGSFIGVYGEANAQVGIDVGVGFSAKLIDTYDRNEFSGATKAEGTKDNFGSADPLPPETNAEFCSIGFEVKAGFKASAGYSYAWMSATDPIPVQLYTMEWMRRYAGDVLEEGSTKTVLKKEACEFITNNKIHFGGDGIDLHKSRIFWTATTGHKEILKVLNTNIPTIAVPSVKSRARDLAELLSKYDAPSDGRCSLVLSSHQSDGKAGLYASAEGKVNMAGFWGMAASAEGFAGISGQYKTACARFQAPFEASTSDGKKDATICVTCDSIITYKSFYFGLNFDFDADYTFLGRNLIKDGVEKGKEKLDKLNDKVQMKPDRLNRISYRAATVVWRRPPPPERQTKAQELVIDTLKGTGVAVGESFVVENLRKFYERCGHESDKGWTWKDEAASDKYVRLIASGIETTPKQTLDFFGKADVVALLQDPNWLPDDMGVLLEATYALPESTKVTVLRELDKNATYNCQLKQETRNRLLECKRRTLESIRLRYRKIDRANDDKSLFTIGFKVSGEGFKIKLSSVERAGADGIVDLCTVFMTPDLANLSPTEAYETCVPAAVLFCQ